MFTGYDIIIDFSADATAARFHGFFAPPDIVAPHCHVAKLTAIALQMP